ncbi:MAG: FAD-dependent oxidoreductase [Actinobacteria bacterium]|nr:FAD-dependent oxidoreductase [Actinomycetota bacterium]
MSSPEPQRWAVVGGGALGATLALRLARLGHRVAVFEAGDVLGGLAAPWHLDEATVGGITWDRHYHVTLLSDTRTQDMYAAAGVTDDEIRWVETKTGYYGTDHVLRSVSNAFEFLKLPGLSPLAKVRLAATILIGSRIRNGHRMERLTAERWLRRWSGSAAFETFWKPLLRAKLGDAYAQASAAFIWATIQRLYAARRTGLKKEMFGYVSGGYSRVFAAFADTLATEGVDVRLSTAVREITRVGDEFRVSCPTGDQSFDKVVVTTNAALAARLCPDLLAAERQRLQRVAYLGIVCVSLVLERPLSPYYLTYITEPATPFTAVVEMTAFIDPAAEVAGKTLVYLPKYADATDPLFQADDAEVIAAFLPFLEKMYPAFTPSQVTTARVSKVAQVFAVPTLGYSDDAPAIGTSVPGLYLAGSAHLPFSTLNVNDTLSLVEQVLALAVHSTD